MGMTRWDPFREFVTLRDAMDRLLEEALVRPGRAMSGARETARLLPVDVYETAEAVVIKAALPGARPDDVEINITGDTLTLRGRIGSALELEEAKQWNWLYHELWAGEFARAVTLPVPVQADKANANFENGILILTLPKAEEIKPKRITIKSR